MTWEAGRGAHPCRHVGLQQLAALAQAGRALLGPVKSSKFVVDEEGGGSVLVSSAARLLESLDLSGAVGQLLWEAVQAQRNAHGSGASTLLSLVGAWSRAADECLHRGVPVPCIVAGMSEGLASCTEAVVALQVPVHSAIGHAGSTETPSGPESLRASLCPWAQASAEPGPVAKEGAPSGVASPSLAVSSSPGRPVKPAAPSRSQAVVGADENTSPTPTTWRSPLLADPRCRRPALTHSRHCHRADGGDQASRPGGGLGPGAAAPQAHGCDSLAQLAAGLSHGDADSMKLAEAAARLQHQHRQASVCPGGRTVPFTFDISRVFTCCLPSFPGASSCVCPGYVTEVPLSRTALVEGFQSQPLRVALFEGDLTETYRHPGFHQAANVRTVLGRSEQLPQDGREDLWTQQVLRVLARLGVRLVLARGSVSERLVERCAHSQRLVIGSVQGSVMQAFAEASGAAQVAYVTQVNEGAVGSGVRVTFWRGAPVEVGEGAHKMAIVLKTEGINLVTVVLACRAPAQVQSAEDRFWACAHRLHCALKDRKVFLGGGAVELLCLSHLQVLATQPVTAGDRACLGGLRRASSWLAPSLALHRPTVLQGLASGWHRYLSTLACNAASHASELDAGTFVQHHLQKALASGSPSSYVLNEHGELSGGIFHAGSSGKLGQTPRVYDVVTAKLEAWRQALDLVLVVLQTDAEIVTGPGHTQIKSRGSEGLLFL